MSNRDPHLIKSVEELREIVGEPIEVWRRVDLRAVGGDDIESLDPSTHQESINVNDTAPSAVFERLEASLAFTAATFAAGDTVLWELSRDKSDAGDTMSADAIVFDVLFEYTD